MRKIVFLVFTVLAAVSLPVQAFDWIKVHQDAEQYQQGDLPAYIQMDKESQEAYYFFGIACLSQHQTDLAKEWFERSLAKNPEFYYSQWGLAEVIRRKHDLASSAKIIEKIIDQHPDFAPAYMSLAYIKYLQLDFNRSLQLTTKIIKMGKDKVDFSNYARAYLINAGARGLLAHYSGPLSKAMHGFKIFPMLERAQDLNPKSAEVVLGLGAFYLLSPGIVGGDFKKAKEYLDRSIAMDPKLADAYARLAQWYKLNNDQDKFNQYLDKALSIDPENELALDIKTSRCRFICPSSKP